MRSTIAPRLVAVALMLGCGRPLIKAVHVLGFLCFPRRAPKWGGGEGTTLGVNGRSLVDLLRVNASLNQTIHAASASISVEGSVEGWCAPGPTPRRASVRELLWGDVDMQVMCYKKRKCPLSLNARITLMKFAASAYGTVASEISKS